MAIANYHESALERSTQKELLKHRIEGVFTTKDETFVRFEIKDFRPVDIYLTPGKEKDFISYLQKLKNATRLGRSFGSNALIELKKEGEQHYLEELKSMHDPDYHVAVFERECRWFKEQPNWD